MGKVGRFVQLVDTQTLHTIQRVGAHDQGAERAGLIGADNDQLQLAVGSERVRTGLHPGVLVHWAVGFFGKEGPALCLTFDGPKLLDDPD